VVQSPSFFFPSSPFFSSFVSPCEKLSMCGSTKPILCGRNSKIGELAGRGHLSFPPSCSSYVPALLLSPPPFSFFFPLFFHCLLSDESAKAKRGQQWACCRQKSRENIRRYSPFFFSHGNELPHSPSPSPLSPSLPFPSLSHFHRPWSEGVKRGNAASPLSPLLSLEAPALFPFPPFFFFPCALLPMKRGWHNGNARRHINGRKYGAVFQFLCQTPFPPSPPPPPSFF